MMRLVWLSTLCALSLALPPCTWGAVDSHQLGGRYNTDQSSITFKERTR
jgi:hypothetical protein